MSGDKSDPNSGHVWETYIQKRAKDAPPPPMQSLLGVVPPPPDLNPPVKGDSQPSTGSSQD